MSTLTDQNKKQEQQAAVELAVFNLNSVTHLEDHKLIAHQIQNYLQVCGQTSLMQIEGQATIKTVANIYALTGSVLDLLLYVMAPQTGAAAVQRHALLAANLIGLFAEPKNEAHARMALRPMFGLMAECLYPANAKVKTADLRRMELHLNARIAGDLELFLQETQTKLTGLLKAAADLGGSILNSLLSSGAGAATATASAGASSEKRDPKLQFNNWASPLIELIQAPAEADVRPKLNPEQSSLQTLIPEAITQLNTVLQEQANAGLQYSLAWLIQETLSAIQSAEYQGRASVPINQTGEYERHTDGDILEFVSLQADALKEPPCLNMSQTAVASESATGNSISYAIGAERISHSDFSLPKIGFVFSRLYNSQLSELDGSSMGARWQMPFSNIIQQNEKGYLFIDGKGRKLQLPASIIQQAYEVPYEGTTVTPLEDGRLRLNFGGAWSFDFESFNSGFSYQLVLEHQLETQEQVQLQYVLVQGQAFLQTVAFKLKQAQQALKFAYNDQGKILAIFVDDEVEPLAHYIYDQQGNLIQAFDENAHHRDYEYNSAHQLTRYTDRTGRGQNIRYDSSLPNAKAIQEWADDGSFKTTLKWHPRLRQVAVYDAYDVPTYYYFDLDGFTYRIRLADGREKWYFRDQYKRITREIDFNGRETQQEFNGLGQLIKIVQPNGGVIRFAYDEQGNLTETKDPEGHLWKKEYDAEGRVTKEINPLGHTNQYKYNAQGQVVEVIDAKGGSKKIQYNDLGQMTAYIDCSGKESAWEYDETGTLLQQQDAASKTVQYIYSEQGADKGQLKAIVYPDGLKEQFQHDQEGRLLQHTDSAGKVTRYQYNAAGLLQQRLDANQHQIVYHWDKQGRISKLVNQNHAEYLFEYNRVGQLLREQGFDGEEKYFSYAENGHLVQIRQPNILTQLTYDEAGQMTSKTYTHLGTRASQQEEFAYNLNGQLSRASNTISQIDFYRNPLGQLIREHQHYKLPNLSVMTAVLRYEYDELGNLSKTIRPDGQELTHSTYGSGHVYAIALNKQEIVGFKRDDLHRETERYLANGLIQVNQYNDVGLLMAQCIQPEQETAGHLQHQAQRQYHYDKNYLLTQVEDSRLGQFNYQYDAIGRLIKTQSPQFTESFSFDPAGNLIDPATQVSQLKNNLIKEYQGKHYYYDEQRNVVETRQNGKTLKLKWDNLNRLVQSEQDGETTEYGYDVFGRRLFKRNQHHLTLFGWDGDLMIWESRQGTNSIQDYTKHYIYEPNSFVPLVHTGYSGFIQLLETPDYQQFKSIPYAIQKDPLWRTDVRKNRTELEQIAFYHCDQVGAPQTLSNGSGECIWEISAQTWGKSLEIIAGQDMLTQTAIRFQGQYYDEETGLHYNRYRYYEPHSGRYLSKDPIGLEGGLNNLAYVSDPNQWVDPLGLNESLATTMKDAFTDRVPGSQIPSRLKNASPSVQMTDRVLTGMNANVTAAALVGVSVSGAYDGNGKYSVKGGNAYGIALAATTTREVLNIGTSKDGKFYEGCASAGAGLAVQTCVGYSMAGGLYANISLGVGLGASVGGLSGEKRSFDSAVPETKIDYEQIRRNQQMLPREQLNFGGLR